MNALVAVLTLPLLGAFAAVALPRRAATGAALACVAATAAASAWLVVEVARGGATALALGGWAPPLGIALRADGLAATMIALTAVVASAVVAGARAPMSPDAAGPRAAFGFWPLLLLLWAALNAVFASRDLFNIYVGMELLGLASVSLVALGGGATALAAAMRYLIFALTGSLLYLAGVVLVYAGHGVLDLDLLAGRAPNPPDALALALMSAGLLAKAALFPFHGWLAPAHSAAPAPASALLSGLVPKAALVVLLRLWTEAPLGVAAEGAALLLGLLGAGAVIWGGLCALAQTRLKLIVAYSTVSQLGYVALALPLSAGASAGQPWAATAWSGAILLILSHAMAKAALFLVAGQWLAAAGGDRLGRLRGLARAMPAGAFAFGLAAITLSGLPPSGGFTAKYLMMTAAFSAGRWGWALVMAAGGLLAAAYLYRPLAAAFAREPAGPFAPVPLSRQAVPLALAGASVLLGLLSAWPLELLQIGRPDVGALDLGAPDAGSSNAGSSNAGGLRP